MRQVISLSIPTAEAKLLKNIAKKRGYRTVSAYAQYLFNADKDLISEKELLKTVRESRREYLQGKSVKAKSMADLL